MSSPDCTQIPINQLTSQPSNFSIAHHSFSGTSLMSMDGPSMGSKTGKRIVRRRTGILGLIQRGTIGSLPDDVLLDIFDFCELLGYSGYKWLRLAHVCRRWRYLVFASPRRLGLRFVCRARTPVREILDAWPPMPIIVWVNLNRQLTHPNGDNIIAALEHPDRVREILLLNLTSSLLERFAAVMQESFPVLTILYLSCDGQTPPVIPDTFLGGFAPRLETLYLSGIPFSAFPRLLLSARDLVTLDLRGVPHTGYISPEAMVTCLSALTSLEDLILTFQSPSSRPDRGSQRPLLLTRVDLPALTNLVFTGVSEYLEDFLARINTPVITTTITTFFNRVIFDIPQLFEFVSRTEALKFRTRAQLFFNKSLARLSIHHPDSPEGRDYTDGGFPDVGVRCDAFDWQISFLVQICTQLLPLLSSVERLDIGCDPLDWQDDVDHMQWLDIFRPFIAVQSLHISRLDGLIAPALQELTGVRVMEVLPALRSLFVTDPDPSGPVWKTIEPFITARHLANQPVTVHQWEPVPDEDDHESEEER